MNALTCPRFASRALLATLGLVLCHLPAAMAQTAARPAALPDLPSPSLGTEQTFELLVHEDEGSTIRETRLGGTVRSISVESKLGGLPYVVVPGDTSRLEPGWNNSHDSAGKARWEVGSF